MKEGTVSATGAETSPADEARMRALERAAVAAGGGGTDGRRRINSSRPYDRNRQAESAMAR
jgi:hypothetical protein